LLLRPRKIFFKNKQKKRVIISFKKNKLNYGQIGLMTLQPVRLTSRHIFRFKLFLKKGSKRVDKTYRKVWLNIFPNLPLTKKNLGSRMGKGKGKLVIWWTYIRPGINIIEFKNLRNGRAFYFLKNIAYKLFVKIKIIKIYNISVKTIFKKSNSVKTETFW